MSVRLVALVSLAKGATASAAEELALRLGSCAKDVAEIERAHTGLHSPGSIGGGDLTWDLLFESGSRLETFLSRGASRESGGIVAALGSAFADLHPAIANTDAVVLEPIAVHVGRRDLVGVKRTLFLRVREGTPKEPLECFERDMLAMPGFVPAIRNWCFSRVRRGAEKDRTHNGWTHVWEQEFETEAGLQNDYMASPYHWGHIDAWFDPECPQSIVDPRIAHVYCPANEGVLFWSQR
jgi:hypothetical protein